MFRFTREFAQKLRAPSRHRPKRSRQAQPILEAVEGRLLLSGGVASHAAHHAPHALLRPAVNPLDRFTVFQATIQRGPNAGMTLQGPLVLFQTGRIQVFGYLYQTNGPPITVVGTAFAGGVDLRFVLTNKFAVEVAGSGQLFNVPSALRGGLTLVGSGNVSGPTNHDHGHWLTIRPAAAPHR